MGLQARPRRRSGHEEIGERTRSASEGAAWATDTTTTKEAHRVSVVMLFVDVPILDPLLSIAITLWVAWNAAKNLKRTGTVFLQAVPEDVELDSLRALVLQVDGVIGLKHLHVWSQEGEHHVLTGHLVVEDSTLEHAEVIRNQVRELLHEAGIEHTTLEVTSHSEGPGPECPS